MVRPPYSAATGTDGAAGPLADGVTVFQRL